jgi:hypothetical protein
MEFNSNKKQNLLISISIVFAIVLIAFTFKMNTRIALCLIAAVYFFTFFFTRYTDKVIIEKSTIIVHYTQFLKKYTAVFNIHDIQAKVETLQGYRGLNYSYLLLKSSNGRKYKIDSRDGFELEDLENMHSHILQEETVTINFTL